MSLYTAPSAKSPRVNTRHPETVLNGDAAVVACLRRINQLIRKTLPDAHAEIAGRGPEGRIDLIARYDSVPVGRTFVLQSECEDAYEADPQNCRRIDEIARGWVVVLSYRAREVAKFRRQAG